LEKGFRGCLKQEGELNKLFSISLLDMLNELKTFRIRTPIERRLTRHCNKKMIEISLSKGKKSVKDLEKELNLPESTIRNILKDLEKESRVKKEGNFFSLKC
jgi:predicted HTH transcriptional regulator